MSVYIAAHGLFMKGVNAMLADDSFTLPPAPAKKCETADCISKWIPEHQSEVPSLRRNLLSLLALV